MKIYVIKDSTVTDDMRGHHCSDTFDGYIVVAENEAEALKFKDPYIKYFTIEEIGSAYNNINKGIILYSWASSG